MKIIKKLNKKEKNHSHKHLLKKKRWKFFNKSNVGMKLKIRIDPGNKTLRGIKIKLILECVRKHTLFN